MNTKPNRTGSSNTNVVLAIGGKPCPKCGSQTGVLEDFHGELFVLCAECGTEVEAYDAE